MSRDKCLGCVKRDAKIKKQAQQIVQVRQLCVYLFAKSRKAMSEGGLPRAMWSFHKAIVQVTFNVLQLLRGA